MTKAILNSESARKRVKLPTLGRVFAYCVLVALSSIDSHSLKAQATVKLAAEEKSRLADQGQQNSARPFCKFRIYPLNWGKQKVVKEYGPLISIQ